MTLAKTFDTHIKAISTAKEWVEYKALIKNNKTMKYRVRTSCLENLDYNEIIREDENGNFIGEANQSKYNRGVIERNPEWFQEIEVVEKGQYWEMNGDILRVQSVSGDRVQLLDVMEDHLYSERDRIEYLTQGRKLSTHEIEQALIKEAKRRGLMAGKTVKSACHQLEERLREDKAGYEYIEEHDMLYFDNTCLYQEGVFAEIVDQTPHIEINGYEVELNKNKAGEHSDDLVKVGCRDVYDRIFKDLSRYADKFDLSIIREGEDITEQINKIAEYYE